MQRPPPLLQVGWAPHHKAAACRRHVLSRLNMLIMTAWGVLMGQMCAASANSRSI